MHHVLTVRHEDALLQREAVDVIDPDRQPEFETEFQEVLGAIRRIWPGDFVLISQPDHLSSRQSNTFEQVIQ